MPRVALTEAQRAAQREADQRKRINSIIRAAMGSERLTAKNTAKKAGIEYQCYLRWLKKGEFPTPLLIKVCDTLNLDDCSRAALLGSSTKCRFDKGDR